MTESGQILGIQQRGNVLPVNSADFVGKTARVCEHWRQELLRAQGNNTGNNSNEERRVVEINHSRADCTEEQGSLRALRSRLDAGEWKGGGTGGRGRETDNMDKYQRQ